MIRAVILIFAIFVSYGQVAASDAAGIQKFVTLESEHIRVGDIFIAPGKASRAVVANAPAPGKRKVLSAIQIRAVARQHGIDWTPLERHPKVVVERASRRIEIEEIENALENALAPKGLSEDQKIRLSNANIRIHGATDQPVAFVIREAQLNRATGRFSAVMHIPHGKNSGRNVPITGQVVSIIDIPVLNRRMKPGAVIHKGDVDLISVESRRTQRNIITDIEALIGKTPKRVVMPGRPIRAGEIRAPILVRKGSLATLTLETGNMLLTVKVRAAEDGSQGETIRVVNTRSNKSVEGLVTGHGRVVVPTMGSRAMYRSDGKRGS